MLREGSFVFPKHLLNDSFSGLVVPYSLQGRRAKHLVSVKKLLHFITIKNTFRENFSETLEGVGVQGSRRAFVQRRNLFQTLLML